eukprot:361555-Rhodomonas_salina.2
MAGRIGRYAVRPCRMALDAGTSLRASYALPGTDAAYRGTRSARRLSLNSPRQTPFQPPDRRLLLSLPHPTRPLLLRQAHWSLPADHKVCRPHSNTRNHIPGTNRTDNVLSRSRHGSSMQLAVS